MVATVTAVCGRPVAPPGPSADGDPCRHRRLVTAVHTVVTVCGRPGPPSGPLADGRRRSHGNGKHTWGLRAPRTSRATGDSTRPPGAGGRMVGSLGKKPSGADVATAGRRHRGPRPPAYASCLLPRQERKSLCPRRRLPHSAPRVGVQNVQAQGNPRGKVPEAQEPMQWRRSGPGAIWTDSQWVAQVGGG